MTDTRTKTKAELELKKRTLEAWTMILYKEGKIDLAKCNRMIAEIQRLKS